MADITHTHLEAALIDQNVAGVFMNKKYAFVAVYSGTGTNWQLGVAVEDEPGYNPIAKLFPDKAEADEWAKGLNEHIGLSANDASAIICSTMRQRRVS